MMTINPQTIKLARRARLSSQTRLLYKLDAAGYPEVDEATGTRVLDLDQAPAVLREIGVPPALREATFATSEFSEVEAVRGWLIETFNSDVTDQDVDRFVLFLGDGSNYTAAAVLRNAVKWGRTAAWFSWHDFTSRYTDGIERSRILDSGSAEEKSLAALETEEASDEDFDLRYVYDVLALSDFDIHDVRDFAAPEITSMFRNRVNWGLITVIAVAEGNCAALEEERPESYGLRGSLLRQFEHEAKVFDGRPDARE